MANHVVAAGAELSVVTAHREVFDLFYGTDEDLEEKIDNKVDLVRVPFFPEMSWPLVNDWPAWRAIASTARLNRWDLAQQTRYGFPEPDMGKWLPRVSQALRSLHRRRPVSLVLATGGPYVSFEAATRFGLAADIPIILDDYEGATVEAATEGSAIAGSIPASFFDEWLAACSEMWCGDPAVVELVHQRGLDPASKLKAVSQGWEYAEIQPTIDRLLEVALP